MNDSDVVRTNRPENELNTATPKVQSTIVSAGSTPPMADEVSLTGRTITSLALVPEKTLVDEAALAGMLGVCRRTIRNMVSRHEIPPPVSLAGRPTWSVERILAHFDKRADDAARYAERAAKKIQSLTG